MHVVKVVAMREPTYRTIISHRFFWESHVYTQAGGRTLSAADTSNQMEFDKRVRSNVRILF